MLDCAGGRLDDGRRHLHRAALGYDDPVRARAAGASDERAEVVRVVDGVGDDDKRRLAARAGDAEDVLDAGILDLRGQRRDALMRHAAAERVQLAPVRVDGRYAALGRFGDDDGHAALARAVLYVNFVHAAAAFEQLQHRVAAGDDVFGARRFGIAERFYPAGIVRPA